MTYESGASSMFTLDAKSRRFFWLGETEAVSCDPFYRIYFSDGDV